MVLLKPPVWKSGRHSAKKLWRAQAISNTRGLLQALCKKARTRKPLWASPFCISSRSVPCQFLESILYSVSGWNATLLETLIDSYMYIYIYVYTYICICDHIKTHRDQHRDVYVYICTCKCLHIKKICVCVCLNLIPGSKSVQGIQWPRKH